MYSLLHRIASDWDGGRRGDWGGGWREARRGARKREGGGGSGRKMESASIARRLANRVSYGGRFEAISPSPSCLLGQPNTASLRGLALPLCLLCLLFLFSILSMQP